MAKMEITQKLEDAIHAGNAEIAWQLCVKLCNGENKIEREAIDRKICKECGHETIVYEERIIRQPTDRVVLQKHECILTDPEDQKKIFMDMFAKQMISVRTNLISLYNHIDNVRFVYNEKGYLTPEWYKEKYALLLKKEVQ